MLLRTLFAICTFTFIAPIQAQDKYFTKDKLEADIKQLKKTLIAIHPGLDYFTPKEVVEKMLDDRLASLPDSMLRMDFFNLLEPIIDTIKCGHTNIQFSHKLYKEKEDKDKPQLFPMELVMLDNEVLVEKDFNIGKNIIPKGSQILHIDSVAIDPIIDQLAKYHKGADGDNHYPERLWAVRGFKGAYARFFGLKDKFVVHLINSKTGKPQTYTLAAVPPNALSKIKKEENKSYKPVTFETVDDGKIGLITIRSFSDKSFFHKHKGQYKKAFKEMRQKNIEKLIIDVRNNGGGAIDNIKYLTKYLFDEEYLIVKEATVEDDFKDEKKSFFQKIFFAFAKKELKDEKYYLKGFSKKNIKPKNKRYQNDLVVLINERSYSAAALTPAVIKEKKRATLIGAEAGGSYHLAFAGTSKYVKLSNTRIKVRVPIIKLVYDVDVDAQDRRKGLLPDIYKKYTKDDLTNGTDTVLEYAIEYLNK